MASITVLPPIAGIVRQFGFQNQAPFTSPDMVNTVPFDPSSGRGITSARPFLTDFSTPGVGGNLLEQISGDSPGNPSVSMVTAVSGDPYYFDGTDWQPSDFGEFLSESNWTSTDWTGGWAAGWDHTTGNTTVLSNSVAAVTGAKYRIGFTVSGRTAGTFTVGFGGQTSTAQSATGTFDLVASTTGNLLITPTSDFDGAIILSLYRTIVTDRTVFGAPVFKKLFIGDDTQMLVYDYEANTLSVSVATAGTFPEDTRVLATHMGTLWASGSEIDGHILYGSRTGDPLDWDDSFTDDGAPFVSTGSFAGFISEPTTALVPIASDMLVVAGETSMAMMLNHPSRSGFFVPMSSTLGILGQGAWCKTDDNQVFALSHEGLVQISPSNDGVATRVSEKNLPASLKGITFDRLNPNVSLVYDSWRNGIIIVVNDSSTPQVWWYDLKTGGFSRWSFGDLLPNRLVQYDPLMTFTKSGVVWAGSGYGGMARLTLDGPETNRPQAWAFLGPIKMFGKAGPQTQGKIQRSKVTFSNSTDTTKGTFAIYAGSDGEDAFIRAINNLQPSYAVENSVLANNNGVSYPHMAGAAAVLVVGDGGSGVFGLESIDLEIVPHGFNRQVRATGYTYNLEFGLDEYSPDYNLPAEEGYALFIPDSVLDATVTDSPNFLNLATIPARWWRGAAADGSNIKATDASNNRLPLHVVHIDTDARTGMVAVGYTQDGTISGAIKLWTNTDQVSIPAVGSTYGQHNVYPSWIDALWLEGDGTDVTSNGFDLTTPTPDSYEISTNGFRAAVHDAEPGGTNYETVSGFDETATAALYMLTKISSTDTAEFSIRDSVSADTLSLLRDESGPIIVASLPNVLGMLAADDVTYPASSYVNDWMGMGAIFDPGTSVTLISPISTTVDTGSDTLTSGTYAVNLTLKDESFALMHLIQDASDTTTVSAYFDALNLSVDGDFWKTPVFFVGDISDIIE